MNPKETAGQRRLKRARYQSAIDLSVYCFLAIGILIVTDNALDIGLVNVVFIVAWFVYALIAGYMTGIKYGRATDADENYHLGYRYGWRMGREFAKHASAQSTQIEESR